jgi:eukaryotic-like serine/threonine-protein kinase
MNKERWRLLEDLFHAALEHPEAGRRQFLEEACGGDAELRAEVESLLGSDPQSSSDTTTGSSMIADRVRRAAVLVAFPPRQGDRIGHYRVVEEIGHGGMGLVYRATRADQEFHMQVAIKVAKTGTDTAIVLERFRRERQILANLDHRYVAKLLDGGTTDDGLPYFVMEYVEGQPIHKYAQSKNLSIRDRLMLFRGVCEAVAYAHQNLVVHLDLKPSNILITADGSPKLLDFGIARLLDPTAADTSITTKTPPLADSTVVASGSGTTALGRLLTPDYASPEQVRGEAVTTATDVYSLGAVLYQLLTGELPHRLDGLSVRQMERVICALDCPPPSERVPALRRQFAGDLDNIVMQAMAKDPQLRYRSAQELDEELRRYLNGMPVRARKGSRLYKAGKFFRRNRLAALATAAVFVSLSAGLVAARWQARLADAQRHVAESESARAERNAAQAQSNAAEAQANARRAAAQTELAEKSLRDAESAQREAVEQRSLADQRFEDVRKLSTAYLFDFNDALAQSPGTLKVRRTMVDLGIGFLDGLAKQAGTDAKLRFDLAAAYMRLGDLLGHPDMVNLGDTKAAMESYRKVLPIVTNVPRQNGGGERVDPDDYVLVEAQVRSRMGDILAVSGSPRDGFAQYDDAVRLARDLLARHEGNLHFEVKAAKIISNHCYVLSVNNSHQAALAAVQDSDVMLQRLIARHPEETEFRFMLVSDYSSQGRSLASTGDLKGSKEAYQKNIDLLEELARGGQARPRLLMLAYSHLGDVLGNPQLQNLGDYAGAVVAYEKMNRIAEASAAADPQNNQTHLDAAMSAGRLGGLRLAQGDPAAALPALQKAVAGLEGVVAKDPNNRSYLRFLVSHHELSGDAHDALGHLTDAKASYGKVIALSEPVVRQDANDGNFSSDFTEGHLKMGLVLSKEGDPAAIEQINLAMAQNQKYTDAHPDQLPAKARGARCLGGRALIAYRLAKRPGVSDAARTQALRQAHADLDRADKIVAELPAQRRTLVAARSLALMSEARRALAEAPAP